jgi:hypothetical protein
MKRWLTILKSVGVVVGAITSAWLLFEAYDQFRDGQIEQLDNDQIILEQLGGIREDVDSLYAMEEKRDDSENEIKAMIKTTESRLIYYIKHEGDMTNEQILDAFEMGFERGKKKALTASDLQEGTP